MVACGDTQSPEPPAPQTDLERGAAYVDNIDYRRAALEQSIVNSENSYSALRLANYGVRQDGWDDLSVWNPPVAPLIREGDGVAVPQEFEAVFEPVEWTSEALLTLGQRAFETYPTQMSASFEHAAQSPRYSERYGLWQDDRDRIGGLVHVQFADGRTETALTCSTCHASTSETGQLLRGRVNPHINIGLLNADRGGSPENVARLDAWGPGRLDVTNDGIDNPTAIGDLRSIRHQSHLHSAATLHNDLIALAIRVETLIITSLGRVARPPREVSFAIAWYLWNLEAPAVNTTGDERGAEFFAQNCSTCHRVDGSTSAPVPLELIGTDDAVGISDARGTGTWRVPSLWGVSTRSQLLHTASVSSVEQLLDPARLAATPGHVFGTHLNAEERAALVVFVSTIGSAP
ncbi:MAG: mono/diheme cytochrome c family protein [Bradymonadia bacterium]